MKNIFKYILCGLALPALFACSELNEPLVFQDSDSFAAFDVTSVVFNENDGVVKIPVTIASVDPMSVTLAYELIDGTAKKGENFNLVDESAVLVFDGETRTMNIEINIIDLAGEYTGDLLFNVSLIKPSNLNLGANSTCLVRICDLDHPLAPILGDYTGTGEGYWDGVTTWAAKFSKDDTDENIVWIDGIFNGCPMTVYGTVADYSNDDWTITIPLGQTQTGSYVYHLYGITADVDTTNEGVAILTRNEDGTYTSDLGFGVYCYYTSGSAAGWWDVYVPEIVLTKN